MLATVAVVAAVEVVVPLGLCKHSGNFSINGLPFPCRTLSSLRTQLSHTKQSIDVLKVDIEGSEHGIWGGDHENCLSTVGQMQIEVHGRNFRNNFDLWNTMRVHGLRLFNK